MSSVKFPVQPKPLSKTYLSTCILDNPDNCQIQSVGVFARISLLFRQSEPLQTPPSNDCFVCKSCSTSITNANSIQMPIFHKPIHDEIYEAMVTKLVLM